MSYPLVDVHAHMDYLGWEKTLPQVLKRAEDAGVKAIISNGTNRLSNEKVLALSKKYPVIKCAMGLYPIDLIGLASDAAGVPVQKGPLDVDEELVWIKKHKESIVAIGEVGMDFHWDKEQHRKQEDNFNAIIEFAKKIKKPLIVHSRAAEEKVIEVLEAQKAKRVVMHCFSGKKALVKKAIDLGFHFSIPANIERAQHFQTIVDITPIPQLLTETDSPWLGPIKDKESEPAFVAMTIKKIAQIKKLDEKEAALLIFKNYKELFE